MGSVVRPSAFVTSDRITLPANRSSTATPAAGLPRAISRTCVEMRAILSPQSQSQAAEGRAGIRVHAQCIALFGDGVPGSVIGFKTDLRDRSNLRQHLLPDLVDNLLNAPRVEPGKDTLHDFSHLSRNRAITERRAWL